ncbi:MAG: C4-type zinc ribbon domain-containing protein, partial [bacterium]|nr:C4-type zinc ribbon domain-containing protein [bacterium]
IKLLEEIQEIDIRVKKIQKDTEYFPQEIERINEQLEEDKKAVDEVKLALEDHEKEKRERDEELSENNEKLKKFEGRLRDLKTNTEYQASLREIDQAKKRNEEIEDELLALMELTEAEAARLAEAEALFAEKQKKADEETKALSENLKKMEKDLSGVLADRAKKMKTINPEVSELYETLKTRINGLVLTDTNNGACNGCYMRIPPQVINEAMRFDKLYQCPSCNRILKIEP